ncbi:MAG: prohibitin family protein [Rhodospirillales bacterium]|nr:prohibitin family protein [Rhodospirillales bacterium]
MPANFPANPFHREAPGGAPTPARGPRGRMIGMIGMAILALLTLFGSYYVVPPTEMAGLTRLGQVAVTQPIGPGLHFKLPFIEHVDMIQTSISRFDLPPVRVHTADNQQVILGISLTYRVPRSAVLHLLYDVGRTGNLDIDRALDPVAADRALRVFARHNTINISLERAQIDAEMRRSITSAVKRLFGIEVLDLQIRSLDYSPAFARAVEAAMTAKADAVQAQNLVLQKKYQADQAVATAKGVAQANIEQAQGAARARVLRAQAQATSIALVAEARAKAVASLGAAMRANPDYARYALVSRWNGAMPATLVGGKAGPLGLLLPGGQAGAESGKVTPRP